MRAGRPTHKHEDALQPRAQSGTAESRADPEVAHMRGLCLEVGRIALKTPSSDGAIEHIEERLKTAALQGLRRCKLPLAVGERASVLDCGSLLPLSDSRRFVP